MSWQVFLGWTSTMPWSQLLNSFKFYERSEDMVKVCEMCNPEQIEEGLLIFHSQSCQEPVIMTKSFWKPRTHPVFYSIYVVFLSLSKSDLLIKLHAEPAALEGDKVAVVILLKQKWVYEKLNLVFILKSLDVTKTQWEPTANLHGCSKHRENLLRVYCDLLQRGMDVPWS